MYLQIVRFPASLSKSLQLTRHPIIDLSSDRLWILNCLTKSFKSDSFFGGFWQDQNFQQDSHQNFIFKTNIFDVSTSAATLPWAGGRFLFMLLLCKDLHAIGSLKKHLEKNHSLLSLICLLTKMATRNFLILQRTFVAKKKWGYRWELAGVFDSYIPLALAIDPWRFHVDVLKGKNSVLRKTDAHFMTKLETALPEV